MTQHSQHPQIGFHAGVGGNRNGIGAYMQQLDAAGLPFVICSVGDGGLVAEACAYRNADHVVIYRQNHDAAGRELDYPQGVAEKYTESAESYAIRLAVTMEAVPEVNANRDRVWIGVLNECDQNQSEWLSEFCLNVAALMNQWGWRVVVLNWALGNPDLPAYDGPQHLALLRYCALNRDMCAYGLHEYSLGDTLMREYPWLCGRWRLVAEACARHGIGQPRFMVKEFGWHESSAAPEPGAAMADLHHFLTQDGSPHVARALWCLQYWHGDVVNSIQRLIEPVTQFVMQNQFPVKTFPAVPPPDAVPETVAAAAREAVRLHPSFVGVIPSESWPACLRSILAHGEVPASSEVQVGEWVAQAGRWNPETDREDGLHLWKPGRAEAVRVDGLWP